MGARNKPRELQRDAKEVQLKTLKDLRTKQISCKWKDIINCPKVSTQQQKYEQ
jgi:hypothetical protein